MNWDLMRRMKAEGGWRNNKKIKSGEGGERGGFHFLLLTAPFVLVLMILPAQLLLVFMSSKSSSRQYRHSATWNDVTLDLEEFHEETDDLISDVFHLVSSHQESTQNVHQTIHTFCHPNRIHIAPASNIENESFISMTISFSLDFLNCSSKAVQPMVQYGREESMEGTIAGSNPIQFNYSSSKSKGIFHSDWIYHVVLPDLFVGSQQYWFQVVVTDVKNKQQSDWIDQHHIGLQQQRQRQRRTKGLRLSFWSNGVLAKSEKINFRTPPLPGSPTSLALIGDLGQTKNSAQTMMQIYKNSKEEEMMELASSSSDDTTTVSPISLILIAGDLSYADSDPYRWISFLDLMEPLFSTVPMVVAAGNHEIECDTTTNEIFVPYESYFRNPNRIKSAEMKPITEQYRKTLWGGSCSAPSVFQGVYNYGNSFYSFQHGLAHIIVLNSYTNATVGSPQYNWLLQELQAYNRSQTPWLVVSFHSPLYTTFLGHVNELEATNMKAHMEPLFIQYGVNFIISGHDHGYMRTVPLSLDQVDETGMAPIYLTVGTGGNREGHSPGYRRLRPEKWVAVRTLVDYGYSHLFLANHTHAHLHWVRDGLQKNGKHDNVWLMNPHTTTVM